MIRISPIGKAAITAIVAILIAGVAVIGLVQSGIAANKARDVANCVNNNLGDRNGVTQQETDAQISDAQAFRTLLHALAVPGKSAQEKLRAYQDYVDEQAHYVRVLVRINKYRAAHPLGQC